MVLELLEAALDRPVLVPPHPQEMGAFGAALAAKANAQAGTAARGAGGDADP